jgi:hypothetical protein
MPSWSVAGLTRTTFHILKIEPERITVQPENGDPRPVPIEDFRRVFEVWTDYNAKRLKRPIILGLTQHSTYIITLLHWVEAP